MSEFSIDVSAIQSPVPAALDALYDFVVDVAKSGGGDQVAVLGTIVEYDIREKSPLYNDYISRAFSDRTVRSSPAPEMGLGDLAERYSQRYLDMLTLLVASIDSELTEAAQDKIMAQQDAITAISDDRRKWLRELATLWKQELADNGIDLSKIDSDPVVRDRYLTLRVRFLKQQSYTETMAEFNSRMAERRQTIKKIRLSAIPDNEARQLVNLYQMALDSKTIRPRDPLLEIKYGWDSYTIQNQEHEGMPDIFDIGPLIETIVEPDTVLKGGSTGGQGYEVKNSDVATNNHDKTWRVSGGGKFFKIVSGSFSGSGESHFRETITKIQNIKVHFAHIARLDIARGGWFSREIFGFSRVMEFLDGNKELARSLALLTTSLIVARGLTLTLYFKDSSDVRQWGSTSKSGGGGVSIGGFKIGGGGGGSASWESRRVNEAEKSVTFVDDRTICRLLGIVITPVHQLSLEQVAYGTRPIYSIPALQHAARAMHEQSNVVDMNVVLNALDAS